MLAKDPTTPSSVDRSEGLLDVCHQGDPPSVVKVWCLAYESGTGGESNIKEVAMRVQPRFKQSRYLHGLPFVKHIKRLLRLARTQEHSNINPASPWVHGLS